MKYYDRYYTTDENSENDNIQRSSSSGHLKRRTIDINVANYVRHAKQDMLLFEIQRMEKEKQDENVFQSHCCLLRCLPTAVRQRLEKCWKGMCKECSRPCAKRSSSRGKKKKSTTGSDSDSERDLSEDNYDYESDHI